MVRLKYIGDYAFTNSNFRFQFLLVRLKEHYEMHIQKFSHISIPYGAIKSRELEIHVSEIIEFQFLMVRLKE